MCQVYLTATICLVYLCRLTGCRYACIGCGWRGPAHEAAAHEAACSHPAKSAADVVALLADRDAEARDKEQVYTHILDLLSYEKITFNGKPVCK